jgi:hypothetical protein
MSAPSESLATLSARTNRETARIIGATYIDRNPDFQRDYEAWSEKLCTRFIESILLGRATNPIWLVVNEDNNCLDVLDGKHRLTTAIIFMNDTDPNDSKKIRPDAIRIGASISSPEFLKYKGKTFSELELADREKIRNYRFAINILDSSYREEDKLNEMYEILNKSSKPLNYYEQKKPLYKPLYDLISPHSTRLLNTVLFPKDKSTRGNVDTEFLTLIALAQPTLPSFSSLRDNYKKWADTTIGETFDDITQNLNKHGKTIIELSKRLINYLDTFRNELRLFDGEDEIVAAKIIVARCAALIPQKEVFNLHSHTLTDTLKVQIFDRIRKDNLGIVGRNAAFQKAVIAAVDAIIHAAIGSTPTPRLFSPAQIAQRLAEQNKQCAICKKEIKAGQKYEGDHIVPWAAGGETVYENLQVVHKYKCHRVGKEASATQEKLNTSSGSPQAVGQISNPTNSHPPV